jgi:hypothetical protein
MAMLPGDYTRRTQTAQKGALTSSGYACSAVHVPAGATNFQVCSSGSVITVTSVNGATTSGLFMYFQDTAGTRQSIILGGTGSRDYKQNFYCPWPVYVSVDADTTVYVAPPSKGAVVPR